MGRDVVKCGTCTKVIDQPTKIASFGRQTWYKCPYCKKVRCSNCRLDEKDHGTVDECRYLTYCPECFIKFINEKRAEILAIETKIQNICDTISSSIDTKSMLDDYYNLRCELKKLKGINACYNYGSYNPPKVVF